MDIQKFQTIVQKIADNPLIAPRLAQQRSFQADDQSKLLETIQSALKVMTTGAVLFGSSGKDEDGKARGFSSYMVVIGLLIELSLVIKREFLDNPEVQAKLSEAWAELEKESAALATAARGVAAKAGEWLEKKNPVAAIKKLTT